MTCHQTELVHLDKITDIPHTFIFGHGDDLASYEHQKDLIYSMKGVTSKEIILLNEDYDHYAFCG